VAGIFLLVFALIYGVVYFTVIASVDRELQLETDKHKDQIFIINGEIRFLHKDEWSEMEHSQIQLNPIFIEIVDPEGKSMDRSPNLRDNHLEFFPDRANSGQAWTLKAGSRYLRQMQIPLRNAGKMEGFLLVAQSFDDAQALFTKLRWILLILFPIVLMIVYWMMRDQANRTVRPIQQLIRKANQVTQSNLSERIQSPGNQEEITQLTHAINDLLGRLEKAIKREQQFTSDASHELRTPLSVLRGTLEVMIRKPRTPEEYEQKIELALQSIDRMTGTIEQLLALARVESGQSIVLEELDLLSFSEEVISRKTDSTREKIEFISQLGHPVFVLTNEKSLQIILDNLLDNAFKYAGGSAPFFLEVGKNDKEVYLKVSDHGVGIPPEDLPHIFDPFFRASSSQRSKKTGAGLGLAIVKKLCDELKIRISVESQTGKGTSFKLSW
ncbi:MAG: two component signal transduction system histidine kinase, partial [Algoriphagus marincola HL-49]